MHELVNVKKKALTATYSLKSNVINSTNIKKPQLKMNIKLSKWDRLQEDAYVIITLSIFTLLELVLFVLHYSS
jgi:hypothetical protein